MVAVGADVAEVRWLRAWSVHSNIKHRPDDFDHYDHRREAQESPDQKLKTAIIRFGEVVRISIPQTRSSYRDATQDAEQELPQLAAKLRAQEQPSIPTIAEGFRLAYALFLSLIPAYTHSLTQSNRTALQNSILRSTPVLLVNTH
jgi:hypothetical protein